MKQDFGFHETIIKFISYMALCKLFLTGVVKFCLRFDIDRIVPETHAVEIVYLEGNKRKVEIKVHMIEVSFRFRPSPGPSKSLWCLFTLSPGHLYLAGECLNNIIARACLIENVHAFFICRIENVA